MSATDYQVAVRRSNGQVVFEIFGGGVRTVLFCVAPEAGDAFAWCTEPTGMVGPFPGTITMIGPAEEILVADADPAEYEFRATEGGAMPELTFSYGIPPEGFQTASAFAAAGLTSGARYTALAMGVSDRDVEHAATAFTAP